MVYLPPSSQTVNSVVFNFEPGQDLDAARQSVLDAAAAQHLSGAYALEREEQFAYQYVEKNLDVFGVVIPLMVLVGACRLPSCRCFCGAVDRTGTQEHSSAASAGSSTRRCGPRLCPALHVAGRLDHPRRSVGIGGS